MRMEWVFGSLEVNSEINLNFKFSEKTRLLIVGGGRVNGESMFPGPSNGETLGEL